MKVTSEEIVVNVNRAGIAAITCNEQTVSMDTWVKNLIAQPLTYTWDGETLTMGKLIRAAMVFILSLRASRRK